MKRTILFVDDESNILQGLKRMLRPMREKWDMHFAQSGAEALKIMASVRMDAVVSDMRMPGMDGPELLWHILQEYPDTIRFALSGYSDQQMVGQSVAPSHQYLTKPCTEERLVTTLEQAMAARDLITNKAVRDKIARIEHLPVLPEVYNRITAELAKGEPSPKLIGEIVAQDVGMSANILKLVNSAYFGLPQHVSAPQQAVIILGITVIRSVILSLHIFNSFERVGQQAFSLPLLWAHCMRVGAIARKISTLDGLDRKEADHAYIAALLHDVGKLLLEAHCADECTLIYKEVCEKNRPVAQVELELLGLTHAQVGAYLLGLWGLPGAVVNAVSRHHEAEADLGPLGGAEIAYFANLLDHDIFVIHKHYSRPTPALARLEAIGGPEKYESWKREVLAMGLGEEEE